MPKNYFLYTKDPKVVADLEDNINFKLLSHCACDDTWIYAVKDMDEQHFDINFKDTARTWMSDTLTF